MNKFFKYSSVLIVVTGILWSCASERPITGGPEDKEAPEVIFSNPVSETVSIDPKTEIFIKFSEQMDKSSLQAALQIWPKPPGGYELKTGWTWLKIKFNEPLDQNETYLLTLNKTAQDLRRNGLASTYVLAFSTGEQINSGRLTGNINGGKEVRKKGDLLLYRKLDVSLSELMEQQADYVFQPDDNGNFEFSYLAERSYMLFYHWDRNYNKIIDGDDYFGRPSHATVDAKPDSLKLNYPIWPQVVKQEQVKLLSLSELSDELIEIRTGLPYDDETLDSFKVYLEGKTVAMLGASRIAEDEFAIHVNVSEPLIDSASVWISNFKDINGYHLYSDTLQFFRNQKMDSLLFEPLRISWKQSEQNRFPFESQSISIKSNLPFELSADSSFKLFDSQNDSISIPGSLKKVTSMTWEFVPGDELIAGASYNWEVQTQHIQSPLRSNDLDSLMSGQLHSASKDSLGSIRIMHMGGDILKCRLTSKQIIREFELKPGTPFLIENLPALEYSLLAYIDNDKNDRYSTGGLEPDESSEPFWVYPSLIKVRARWETDIGVWELKQLLSY